MKRTRAFKLVAVFAFAAALCFALVGCGGGGGADNAKNFIGTWELESSEGENALTAEDMEMVKSLGINVQIILNEDKTATFDMMGETRDGTWEAKSATEASITIDGESLTMKLDNEKLSFELEGDKLVFVMADK